MLTRSRVLPLFVGLVSAALFVRLGFWQLSRLHERRTGNTAAAAARQESPLDLNTPGIRREASLADRQVLVRGQYDRTHEIVLRNHVYRDAPGVWLVTPLRIAGSDSAVLVNRGFVPAPDAVTPDIDSLAEPGELTVHGVVTPLPITSDSGEPLTSRGHTSWKRLDLAALRRTLPYPILPVSILQAPDRALPSRPIRLDPAPLDDGPHLSYAIQWFSFAVIGLVGGILLARENRTEPQIAQIRR
ncbi:MAG: SURF1 family protein [Gemmatimonadota bacterium]